MKIQIALMLPISQLVSHKYFTLGFGIIPQTPVGYLLENNYESISPVIVDRHRGEGY